MTRGGLRVIVVEDEFLVATMIEDMLVEGGHSVLGIADDYDSALALAGAEKPDLALLDIQLIGRRTGLDVARELSQRGVACMFATGNCPGDKARGLALACLHKPFSQRDLLGAIDAVQSLIRGDKPAILPRPMHVI
ncbi:MAG: response regulator [Hyphomicrobiales bacterium]|nr:response regulator [Hyphomicrobiales bacterium]